MQETQRGNLHETTEMLRYLSSKQLQRRQSNINVLPRSQIDIWGVPTRSDTYVLFIL